MTRRGLIAPALASLAAACSPLVLLDRFGPRDAGARRIRRSIAYGDHPRQRMDVYTPSRPGAFPTLVFFYGGGWNSGSRDLYGWAAQALASRGFVVFLPDYRLVPEVVFPVFIEDAAAATARAADLAPTYGGDAGRLAVLGHSAGAYLALMIALDARYMMAAGRPDVIRAAVGLAGPYEFLPLNVASSIDAFGAAPDPAQTQPVTFARGDAPPVWLGHGADDTVVHDEDTLILNDRIRAAGGRSTARIYPGLNHADLIATFSPLFRKKAPVLHDVVAFLRQHRS
ncbi:alpha/beta hydrolase [Brevundimonas sp. UBA7534]|uniref:alpha/beta hydrolase n=1 Tax=Brevundimonas sp. UBA7534 TaxID=1946138 RepID=UPI0025BB065E|nr:alpha/beta hydrolase [Brevundimonas sp. UBA7534]